MTPEQARAARSILRIGVREVSEATGVTPNTVSRLENPNPDSVRGAQASTISAVKNWYETQGVSFLSEGDIATGAGVSLKESTK